MSKVDAQPLAGRRIAVPESRELNLFAQMLETRGADVIRRPLVAIHDSPNRETVETWLRDFCQGDFDDLILLTGEGLRRLLGFAERAGGNLPADFGEALKGVRKITRGPKPANALRKIGLKSDLAATEPTTDGVIDALDADNLNGRKMGVQLYGEDPNHKLVTFLEEKGADVRTVAPYVYADDAENALVADLIDRVVRADIDAVAFTSSPQVRRLFKIAEREGRREALVDGLNHTVVAAVGPVVAEQLREAGIAVDLMPESTFFMKPLVRELVKRFSGQSA